MPAFARQVPLIAWTVATLLACGSIGPAGVGPGPDAGGDSGPDAGDAGPDGGGDAGPDGGLKSVDCALSTTLCTVISIGGESPAAGRFHGYADPSMRKDPNSGLLHFAWSWPNVLANGTINVELHLGHSADLGGSWTRDGVLFSSRAVANPGGANYAAANQSSDEVIDLFPIDLGAQQTRWVQAHMSYLVPTGTTSIYAQIDTTNYVSISSITVGPGDPPAKLLELATAPEARLGNKSTDASLAPTTNLSALPGVATNNCTHWDQPALFAQAGTLYLALQCLEAVGDGKAASHFVYTTTPTGDDARAWTWHFAGIFATQQEAARLGQAEGVGYQLFTELQLVTGASGQLLAIITPAIATPGAIQPATQYGCRAIPIKSLIPPALQTDAAGAPLVVATVLETDLYDGANQGNGACSYEPASSGGIVIVRKLEADPQLGFFVSLQATGLRP